MVKALRAQGYAPDPVMVWSEKTDPENANTLQYFDYLGSLELSMWSEKRQLQKLHQEKQEELKNIQTLGAKKLWEKDLDEFLEAWEKLENEQGQDIKPTVKQETADQKPTVSLPNFVYI